MSALPAKACRWSSSNSAAGQPSSARKASLRAAQRGAATGVGCKGVKNRGPSWVRRCVQFSTGKSCGALAGDSKGADDMGTDCHALDKYPLFGGFYAARKPCRGAQ